MKQLTNLFAVAGLAVICTACPGGSSEHIKPGDDKPAQDSNGTLQKPGNPNTATPLDIAVTNNSNQPAEAVINDPNNPSKPGDSNVTLEDATKAFASFKKTSAYRWKRSERCGAGEDVGVSGTSNWYGNSKIYTWTDGTYELAACVYDGVVFTGDLYGKRTNLVTTEISGDLDLSGDVHGKCGVALVSRYGKQWDGKFCNFDLAELTAGQPDETPVIPSESTNSDE